MGIINAPRFFFTERTAMEKVEDFMHGDLYCACKEMGIKTCDPDSIVMVINQDMDVLYASTVPDEGLSRVFATKSGVLARFKESVEDMILEYKDEDSNLARSAVSRLEALKSFMESASDDEILEELRRMSREAKNGN